ncbi:MAG: CRISPR-associated RAMP protein Csx7 [Anaerolineae bacterium]|nr:CRISPR-associated RAMP protein Csx7 [Anaerolineae bacterium]
MATWETFESRFVITARLVAATALRVGAGGAEAAQPAASDLPVILAADDRPFIPGASLRGVLRSQVERLVRALEPKAGGGRGACNPVVEAEWCITSAVMDDLRQKSRGQEDPDRWLAKQVWDGSCRVCRVFGSPWLASRVRIADLPLSNGSDGRIERRDGVSIHREKETVQNKYDFEAVPAGTAFDLRITLENLTSAERGLVWLGLQELRDGYVLLGGFKGRGLGRAELADLRIVGVEAGDRQALKRYLLQRTLLEVSPQEADRWLKQLLTEMEAN